MANREKLVIRQVSRPGKNDPDALLEWFCEVFNLSNKGDAMEPALLKEIMGSSVNGEGVTSKGLNERLDVPRSTVIYHLNQFISTGLVIRRGRRYYLRSDDLASTLEEMQADMEREFSRMIDFAQRMDEIFEGNTNARRKEKQR